MAKYYYNGVLLPEIPSDVLAEYPYCWIRKNTTSGNYDLVFGKQSWYNNNGMYCQDETSEPWYVIPINGSENATEWIFNKTATGTFGVDSSRTVMWSNFDIPNGSATSTTIYFSGNQPILASILASIQLVNKCQSSSNSTTSCSFTMSGCTVGNTLILAYAVRGDGNDPTLTNGWVKLGGGNNTSDIGDSNQRLYFAYKVVTSESETITLTQTSTGRIYMVCSEYSGISSVLMRDDLASYGASNYTVTGSKSEMNDVMLYAVTSAYYASGRSQTVAPNDLVKIEGNLDAERLACWFDDGVGSLEHTFKTCESTENRDVVLECVQLFSSDEPDLEPEHSTKYLLKSEDMLCTVIDGELVLLDQEELTAEVFHSHGFDELPDWSVISELTNPEILYWQSADVEDELPTITANMTATPYPQTIISTNYDMSDDTILGVECAYVTASSDVVFAISVDDGVTWNMWTGEAWGTLTDVATGMTAETINAITTEQWAGLMTTGQFKVRATLFDENSSFTSFVMDYIN